MRKFFLIFLCSRKASEPKRASVQSSLCLGERTQGSREAPVGGSGVRSLYTVRNCSAQVILPFNIRQIVYH